MQLVMGAIAAAKAVGESQGGIAFGAHIGGFIAGLALITFFKHRHVPLWRRH
jgi:membrane associated rhomboid family serine protease